MLSRNGFSVAMASRFEIVDKEYTKELKDKSENESTKNSTEYWKTVFKKWANERNFQQIQKSTRAMSSTKHCRKFYAFRNSVILPSML